MHIDLLTEPLPFQKVYQIQQRYVKTLLNQRSPEVIILCEHTPTITCGRRFDQSHLLTPLVKLQKQGVAVQQINRGGSTTAHEPGQLVIYPILSLKQRQLRVSDYVNRLMTVGQMICGAFGAVVTIDECQPGLWIGDRKVANIGVEVRHHDVTLHGLSLNINNSLDTFRHIAPCGDSNTQMTSLSQEVGTELKWPTVLDHARLALSKQF